MTPQYQRNSLSKALPFHEFCNKVLRLVLTRGQSVIAKCVFGDLQPHQLPVAEQNLAMEMLGGLEALPTEAKRIVVLRLGRGSGKTSLASAWSIYKAVTSDLRRCGPGDVPVVVVVAPDKNTAKLSIRMSREMLRAHSSLDALVEEADDERIMLRRPDGRRVCIEAIAASRGGSSVRGRSILTFLLDEAEFFRSDDMGGFKVNDKDIYGALIPRLLPDGKGIFLSTPWPVETLMGTLFQKNWSNPQTAIAVQATTQQMRGEDEELCKIIELELQRDPETARREFFCEVDSLKGGEFFDAGALNSAIDVGLDWPIPRNPLWPCAIGADFAFRADSSALVVVQFDGKYYRTSDIRELRPTRTQALKPSEVIKQFATVCKRYGVSGVIADGHYREALKEHLSQYGLTIFDAPEGIRGKADVFTRTKSVLNEGLLRIPDNKRLIEQAKLVVARAAPGGSLSIRMPRRIGMGHGDIISAWTLAVHHLAYAQAQDEKPKPAEEGTPEWEMERQAHMIRFEEERQKKYLKSVEAQMRRQPAYKRPWR